MSSLSTSSPSNEPRNNRIRIAIISNLKFNIKGRDYGSEDNLLASELRKHNFQASELRKHNFQVEILHPETILPLIDPPNAQILQNFTVLFFRNNYGGHLENHIFINDAGSSNYICSQALKLKKGQRELTSGAFYSMGIALPLAIGAAVTQPDSQVIAITGDGSIELNIQKLRTLSQNNLNVKLFIINNGGYASIRKSQDEIIGGGRCTDDEEVLNCKNVAKAFERQFEILDDFETLTSSIEQVLSKKGPA